MDNYYIEQSLFPEYISGNKLKAATEKEKQRWQFCKSKNFGLEYCANATFQGKYGIVLINKYVDTLPNSFITLHETNSIGSPNIGVVGFSYDYELERLSNNLQRYAPRLAKYKCICEPDFSMKIGDPLGGSCWQCFQKPYHRILLARVWMQGHAYHEVVFTRIIRSLF